MNKVFPEACLFDWDGTLVNSWPIIHESMNHTLDAMGHEIWTREETAERARKSLRETFPKLFGDRWEEAREIFYTAYRSVHLERVEKMEAAEDLIDFLYTSGCHLGVVSNKSGSHLRAESSKLGWDKYFGRYLIGSTDAARDKPAPDPVYLALNDTGIAPSEKVWFIGDTWVDVACGRASGCLTVLIGNSDTDTEDYENNLPHKKFLSCREFFDVVRQI